MTSWICDRLHRPVLLLVLAGLVFGGMEFPALAQETLVDRVVAVVDDDPILQSDLDRLSALGGPPVTRNSDSSGRQHQLLETLVEQRLRFHEVERYGFNDVPLALVESRIVKLEAQYESPIDFSQELLDLGLTREDLGRRIQRELAVLTYVDELLGARVFIGLEEIQQHYTESLVPELEQAGGEIPQSSGFESRSEKCFASNASIKN